MSLQGTLFSVNEINGLTDSISCFVKESGLMNDADGGGGFGSEHSDF